MKESAYRVPALPCLPLQRIRSESRVGRKWLEDARKAGADVTSGLAHTTVLRELVAASAYVWPDVGANVVERMLSACALHCVCAQPYAAPMVECPACKCSFHYECVGFKGAEVGQTRAAVKAEARAFRCPPCATQLVTAWLVSAAEQAFHYIKAQARNLCRCS